MNTFDSFTTEALKDMKSRISQELSRRRRVESARKRSSFISTFDTSKFDNATQANAEIQKHNSENILSIRNEFSKVHEKEKYLPALIMQDWSHLYPSKSTTGDYYVYVHTDPRERVLVVNDKYGGNYGGTPFYIGKGCGKRAYNLKRNQGHGKVIKDILSSGFDESDIVRVVFDGLSEQKALEIESKLIYFFKTIYQDKKFGTLYNLDVPKIPEFTGVMEKIKLNREFN